MKINKFGVFLVASFMLTVASSGQINKKATDYLGVPGPVVFNKKSYNLSWSSHPSGNYYKHEYLPAGENPDKFITMLLLEVVTGNAVVKDIASAKLAELKKMKEANPVINYEVFDNPKTGEYMIDFLLTANGPDGRISIAERNVYRYKAVTDASGQKGILLFGVSTRSYGAETTSFIAALKSSRKDLVNQAAQFNIPPVKISR